MVINEKVIMNHGISALILILILRIKYSACSVDRKVCFFYDVTFKRDLLGQWGWIRGGGVLWGCQNLRIPPTFLETLGKYLMKSRPLLLDSDGPINSLP